MKKYMFAILLLTLTVILTGLSIGSGKAKEALKYNDLYVCLMHPWAASEGPSTCDICGMKLSPVHNHKPGTPLPAVENLYVKASDPAYIQEGMVKGSDFIPIIESPFYQPKEQVQRDAMSGESKSTDHSLISQESSPEETAQLWTCGMHPQVISDRPGKCPICHMDLVPLKKSSGGSGSEIRIDPVIQQNIGVLFEEAEIRDLSRTITTDGVIVPAEDSEYIVNARVSGWVEKLYADKTGEWVSKGQPLFELYSPELTAAQREFIVALNTGSSQMQEFARKKLELWNLSPKQISELERDRVVKPTMTITSPAEGFIREKSVIEGAAIKAGEKLFKIADLRKIWVRAYVYEFELPWIKEGGKVTVKSPYIPELQTVGVIDYIQPMLDPKTHSAEIRIILNNSDLKFKTEMYVEVGIGGITRRNVVSVSKEAVLRSGKRDLVFVDKGNGIFEPREVHIGLETDDYYEIIHNLEAGEKVVTSAQFLLDSEAKLNEALKKRLQMQKNLSPEDNPAGAKESQNPHIHN